MRAGAGDSLCTWPTGRCDTDDTQDHEAVPMHTGWVRQIQGRCLGSRPASASPPQGPELFIFLKSPFVPFCAELE